MPDFGLGEAGLQLRALERARVLVTRGHSTGGRGRLQAQRRTCGQQTTQPEAFCAVTGEVM